MKERSEGSRLKGCALGCGLLALGAVLVPLVVSVRTCVPLRSAGKDRVRLEERFGPAGSFTPAPDGAIPPDRMERFLEVRRSIDEACERLRSVQDQMFRVENLEDRDASGREVAGALSGLGQAAVDITPVVGEYFQLRNRSLLGAEMGLGEYTYIYAVAYRERFLDGSIEDELFAEGGAVSPHAATVLRSILERQRDGLGQDEDSAELRRRIEREIDAMRRDAQRLPWRDGANRALESSLAPFRSRLDAAFCPALAGIEMDRDSGRALKIALY